MSRKLITILSCLIAYLFLPFLQVQAAEGEWTSDARIADLIAEYYNLFLPLAGILAAVMIMVGGVIWLTSGGNAERIGQAKSYISGAIIGLILALFSYSLLYYINPDLVDLKPLRIYQVTLVTLEDEEGVCFNNNDSDCPRGFICNMAIWCGVEQRNAGCCINAEATTTRGMACENSNDCGSQFPYCLKPAWSPFKAQCFAGIEYDPCDDDDNNCKSGLHCINLIRGDQCFDGSTGDPCDDNSDCINGNCRGDKCL